MKNPKTENSQTEHVRMKKYIRSGLKYIGLFFVGLITVLTVFFVCLRFQFAENAIRNYAVERVNAVLSPYSLQIEVGDLDLNLPFSVRIRDIGVKDGNGVFFHLEALNVHSRLSALLRYRIAVPGIEFKHGDFSRIPELVLPVSQEKSQEETVGLQEKFKQIHALLFHKHMPSVLISNISFEHIAVSPAVFNSLKTVRGVEETFFDSPLVFEGNVSASLEKELFQFEADIAGRYKEQQAYMESLFDMLPNEAIRFSFDYADEHGLFIALAKEFAGLGQSKRASSKISAKLVGTFEDFALETDISAFDEKYLKDTATISARCQTKPFKGQIALNAKPVIAGVLDNSDISATIDLDTFSVSDTGEKLEKMQIVQPETGETVTVDPNIPFADAAADGGEIPNKNVRIACGVYFKTMEFVHPMLRELLGSEQSIDGQFDVQFFTRQLPRFFARNVNFTAKNIRSETNIAVSREIFANSVFNIKSFSFLDSNNLTVQGNLAGKLNISGKLENPHVIIQTEIPQLLAAAYPGELGKKEGANAREYKLENLQFTLKSEGFEKDADIIPLDIEKMRALYQKHQYAASIERMRELFHSAVNYPVKLFLSFKADYMDEHSFLNSEIRMSPKVLGLGENKNKFVDFTKIRGSLFGISVDGALHIDLPETIEEDYAFAGKIQGKIADTSALENAFFLPLQAEGLSYLAEFNNTGAKGQQVRFSLIADKGLYSFYEWENFQAKLGIDDLWKNAFVDSAVSMASMELADIGKITDFSLSLQGLLNKMALRCKFGGDANFDAKAALSTNFEYLSGSLDSFSFAYPYKKTEIRLQKKAGFYLSPSKIDIGQMVFNVAPKGKLQFGGQITENSLNFKGLANDIDLSMLPRDFKGVMTANFGMSGSSRSPQGKLEMLLKDFQTLSSPKMSFSLKGNIVQAGQEHRANLKLDMLDKDKYGVKEAGFSLQIPLQYSPLLTVSKNRPVLGKFAYTGSLKTLWSYVPLEGRSLEGELDLKGNISGTLSRPDVNFEAETKRAKYQDLILGILLTDLNFESKLQKGHGTVRFSAKDGRKGTVITTGSFDIPFLYHGKYKPYFAADEKKGEKENERVRERKIRQAEHSALIVDLKTVLANFSPFYRNDFNVRLSGFVTAGEMIENPKIHGDITVEDAEVHLENIRTSSIPKLNIVEDSSVRIRRKKAGSQGNLDIAVHIPKQLGVYAPGIETLWRGDLSVFGKLQDPAVKGYLRAWKGRMIILNSELKLNKGEILFDGSTPVIPTVDLKLEHNGGGVKSFISLKGMALRPKIEISSSPHLPSDEVLAHILFSRSMSELSDFEKIRLATVLASLVGFDVSAGITGTTKNLFGLDVISVDNRQSSSGEEEISIQLGKYLKNNLYLGLEQEVNSPDTSGVLKYEMNENFSVGTKLGTEDSEVGFQWKYDY